MSGFPSTRAFDGLVYEYHTCARSPAGVASMAEDLARRGYDSRAMECRGLLGVYVRRRGQ